MVSSIKSPPSDACADLAGTVLRLAREVRLRELYSAEVLTVLPSSSVQVMQYIDVNPGTTPSAVAGATGLQRTNTSTTLRQLEALGFIKKLPDPDDGRSVRLYPTDRAVENLEAVRRVWSSAINSVLHSSDDIGHVISLLDDLARGLAEDRRANGLSANWR